MNNYAEEKLDEISQGVYDLNVTLENLIWIFCQVMGKPLAEYSSDSHRFEMGSQK